MSLLVLEPGLYTTVQDGGRPGMQRYGVSVGGAMDYRSLYTANAVVGNALGAAALEMTLNGATLEAQSPLLIAACGARLAATADGIALPMYRPVRVRAGTVLRFGAAGSGCRAYVAVRGGIDVPLCLGGYGAYAPLGGDSLAGRALRRGDRLDVGNAPPIGNALPAAGIALPIGDALPVGDAPPDEGGDTSREEAAGTPGQRGASSVLRAARWHALPFDARSGDGAAVVRVIRGSEYDEFDEASRRALFAEPFTVSARSDRMGCRLTGRALSCSAQGLVSEPVSCGAVQVPPDGAPIVLMADSQTIGGYPRIAHVVRADWPTLAQLRPGERVRFAEIALEQAHELLREERRYYALLARSAAEALSRGL